MAVNLPSGADAAAATQSGTWNVGQSGTWNVGHGKTLKYYVLSQSVAGTAVVEAASPGNRHKLVGFFGTMGLLGTLKFTDGTGDLCGAMNVATTGGLVLPTNPTCPYVQTAVNSALNVVSGTGAANGGVIYITEP